MEEFEGELRDWRLEEGISQEELATADPAVNETSVPFCITHRPGALHVNFNDGNRQVWFEVEGDAVVMHVYDQEHDEPVNIRLHQDHIEIDGAEYFESEAA